MDLLTPTKYWLRSGSLQFARDRHAERSARLSFFAWHEHTVYYRPGTSDTEVLYKILLKPEKKREYQLPELSTAPIILDIGANIGAFSLLALNRYPDARVFAFEPVKENFEVLKMNLLAFKDARPFNCALGRDSGEFEFFQSDNPSNLGGFSQFEAGSDASRAQTLIVQNSQSALDVLELDQIDLIKIDTEGAEFDILTSIKPKLLARTHWILGELHGQKDFELLSYLSQWFDVEIHKPLSSRLSHFRARNVQSTQ